ncbi:hypothetical protein FACS189491_12440 [Spirochaetia bacterium]|nr:hypothetical protein FACS189491_12440 [Spirochaetia bacterium]
MKDYLAATAIAIGVTLVALPTSAKVPCEETLKEVRAAREAAKPADPAKVDDLINKGINRCNADDDTRANDFFNQALAALGK